MVASRWLSSALVAVVLAACGPSDAPATPSTTPSPNPAATLAATSTTIATPSPTNEPVEPSPTPTPLPPPPDIWASHLLIPSLGIDTEVQISEVVPVTGGGVGTSARCQEAPATGPSPQASPTLQPSVTAEASPSPSATGGTTFTVPTEGVATPRDAFDHLQYRSWIFGHSRWQGVPGLFFTLQEIEIGDELFVDGTDRFTGDPIEGARFVVTGIYLADTGGGAPLVSGDRIGPPGTPLVILQTSVRESGANRPWILDRETVLEKAENVVEGDLDDPCKYLLLFVVAEHAP